MPIYLWRLPVLGARLVDVTLIRLSAAAGAAVLVSASASITGATASVKPPWKNCVSVNTRYPHGVGKANAHDHTVGGALPVTTFRRSTKLYTIAMRNNRRLDRDHDGIACETA